MKSINVSIICIFYELKTRDVFIYLKGSVTERGRRTTGGLFVTYWFTPHTATTARARAGPEQRWEAELIRVSHAGARAPCT